MMKEENLAFNNSRPRGSEKINPPKCTACSCIIDFNNPNEVMQHPILKVLLCSLCYKKYIEDYRNNPASKMCVWCVEKGDFSCRNCARYLCTECVERNFGLNEVNIINKNNWTCYVCNPSPLEGLVKFCQDLMDIVLDYEDTDQDGVSMKELNKMCWLEHLMDNFRHHLEDSCEKIYHLKYKLRLKRPLFENQTELDKEYISLLLPLGQDVLKNSKYFSDSLNAKQNELQPPKNRANPTQIHPSFQKNHYQKNIPEIVPKTKFQVNSHNLPLVRNLRETHPDAGNTSASTLKVNNVSARIKRSAPNPTSVVSPDTQKKFNQILKNQNIVVSSPVLRGVKRRLVQIDEPKVLIKKEPESPPHEEEFELDSLLPPVPKPSNMKFSRVKYSGNRNYNYTEPPKVYKPVAQPEPVPLPVQIKEEPIDDSEDEEDHNFHQVANNHNSQYSLVKQEHMDDWNDSKHMDSEEDDSPHKSPFTLIEELKNRKELSIQSTNLVTVKDFTFYGGNTNYSVSRTTVKKEGQVLTKYSKLPEEHSSGVSGVIDLLKACEPSNPMMVMMSEEEESDENNDCITSPIQQNTTKKSSIKESLMNHSKSLEVRVFSKDAPSIQSSSSQNSISDRLYICDQCGVSFSAPEELKNHVTLAHDRKKKKPAPKSLVCNFCDKHFKTKTTYDKHMKLHDVLSDEPDKDLS